MEQITGGMGGGSSGNDATVTEPALGDAADSVW